MSTSNYAVLKEALGQVDSSNSKDRQAPPRKQSRRKKVLQDRADRLVGALLPSTTSIRTEVVLQETSTHSIVNFGPDQQADNPNRDFYAVISISTKEVQNPTDLTDEQIHWLYQYTGLLHELSHIFYSDQSALENILKNIGSELNNKGVTNAKPVINLCKHYFNLVEDGAIEAFLLSDRGGNMMEVCFDEFRKIVFHYTEAHVQPDELPETADIGLKWWEAIETLLVDQVRYDSGYTDALFDADSTNLTFATKQDRQIAIDLLNPTLTMVAEFLQERDANRRYKIFEDYIINHLIDKIDPDTTSSNSKQSGQGQSGDSQGDNSQHQDQDTQRTQDDPKTESSKKSNQSQTGQASQNESEQSSKTKSDNTSEQTESQEHQETKDTQAANKDPESASENNSSAGLENPAETGQQDERKSEQSGSVEDDSKKSTADTGTGNSNNPGKVDSSTSICPDSLPEENDIDQAKSPENSDNWGGQQKSPKSTPNISSAPSSDTQQEPDKEPQESRSEDEIESQNEPPSDSDPNDSSNRSNGNRPENTTEQDQQSSQGSNQTGKNEDSTTTNTDNHHSSESEHNAPGNGTNPQREDNGDQDDNQGDPLEDTRASEDSSKYGTDSSGQATIGDFKPSATNRDTTGETGKGNSKPETTDIESQQEGDESDQTRAESENNTPVQDHTETQSQSKEGNSESNSEKPSKGSDKTSDGHDHNEGDSESDQDSTKEPDSNGQQTAKTNDENSLEDASDVVDQFDGPSTQTDTDTESAKQIADNELTKEKKRGQKKQKKVKKAIENLDKAIEEGTSQTGAGSGKVDTVKINTDPSATKNNQRVDEAISIGEKLQPYIEDLLVPDRRTEMERGKTTGRRVDKKNIAQVTIPSPRVFSNKKRGSPTEYEFILVLDRSGSMGGNDIRNAETAILAIAHALSELDISVRILDLYENTSRIVTPETIEPKQATDNIINGSARGGTPLGDAVWTARQQAKQSQKKPILIAVTDGRPNPIEDYNEQVESAKNNENMTVFGVTIGNEEKINPEELYDSHESFSNSQTISESLMKLIKKASIQ